MFPPDRLPFPAVLPPQCATLFGEGVVNSVGLRLGNVEGSMSLIFIFDSEFLKKAWMRSQSLSEGPSPDRFRVLMASWRGIEYSAETVS